MVDVKTEGGENLVAKKKRRARDEVKKLRQRVRRLAKENKKMKATQKYNNWVADQDADAMGY